MFANILSGVILEAKFDELFWNISKGLMNIVNAIEKAFRFVIGQGTLVDPSAGESVSSNDLLSNTFKQLFGAEGSLNKVYLYMVILCMLLMVVFTIIGVIKAQFTKDSVESMRKLAGKGFWSLFKMLLVPIFFFISLLLVGAIFDFLISLMQNNSSESLAAVLCRCFSTNPNIEWNSSYEVIKKFLAEDQFDFLLCILTSACLIVTLVTATLAVTKRFIKIFFYYITAPIVLSKSMLDEGKSWDLWKDNYLAQLLGAGGVIICMYLFVRIVPIVAHSIDVSITDDVVLRSILKIVFILGMSTVPAGATALMAQLISQGSGQNESNDLMHTQQMMGNGMRLAGLAAGKALAGGLTAMSGGAGGLAGVASKAIGIGGPGGAMGTAIGAAGTMNTMGAAVGGGASAGSAAMSLGQRIKNSELARATKVNQAAHQGGANWAIMRGGMLGAVGYAAARGVSLLGTTGKTLAKKAARGIGKIPNNKGISLADRREATKELKTARREAKHSQGRAVRGLAKENNIKPNRILTPEQRMDADAIVKNIDLLKKDGKEGSPIGSEKYFNKQFGIIEKAEEKIDKRLKDNKYPPEAAERFKQQMLGEKVSKIEREFKNSALSKNSSFQERMKNAKNYVSQKDASEGVEK